MSEDKMREVVEFLCGTGELCGVTFGDIPDGESGKYWWRKHLRSALSDLPQQVKSDARDAARYRYLRNRDIENDFPLDGLFIGCIPDNVVLSMDDADDAIDAAISAQENKS